MLLSLFAVGTYVPAKAQTLIIHTHYDAKRYVGEYRVDLDRTADIQDRAGRKGVCVVLNKVVKKGEKVFPPIAFSEGSGTATAEDLKKAVRVTLEPTVFLDRLWVTYYDITGRAFFASTMYPLDERIKKK
jgi:hypothetical protein